MAKRNAKRNGKSTPTTATVDEDGYELIGGAAGKEMAVGEVVTGRYGGVVRTMPGKRKGSVIPFYQVGDRTLLGSTVLRDRFEEGIKLGKLKEGDMVRVTRIEDAKPKRGQNAAKVYTVGVKRAS